MEKREQIYRGKTKAVFATDDPKVVILENFDALTKFDNPELTKQMEGKAKYATRTTCNVFRLLKSAGIPVAFIEQLSETEFSTPKCRMIPLEVIDRRYGVGSYLERYPNLKMPAGCNPVRFHALVFEIFLKTTGKIIKTFDGVEIGTTPVEDPLIEISDSGYELRQPKVPSWSKDSLITALDLEAILPGDVEELLNKIAEITRKTFLVLEGAWAQLGFRLIDFKIEFGIDEDGNLLVADVIDNDSWRLRTSAWEEVSKETFRQNANLEEVGSKYALVAGLSDLLHLPKQAIVSWRGSENDPVLALGFAENPAIAFEDIVISGHKSPELCLEQLEETLSSYPEGGVIIAAVGLSNGLGPILAARTSWPVIAVPLTAKENPNDVWSSLNLPSQVPLVTVLNQKNAILAALNMLAQKNPYAYMLRQYALEELDL